MDIFLHVQGSLRGKYMDLHPRTGHLAYDGKRSGHNMDILLQSETAIRVTAVRLRIRIYKSNDLYEGANPCTFPVGSPVLEEKYPYSVQIFFCH